MKKMNSYEAPVAEVIEMNLNATVLSGSNGGPWQGDQLEPVEMGGMGKL